MVNKYLTYIFILLLTVGCSDEFGLPDGRGIQSDGTVELTFSVPAATVVNTRATDEYQVNDITVLIFNGNDNDATLKQEDSFSGDNLISLENNKYKVSFKLDDNIKTLDNLQFYFIANLPTGVSFQKETTLSTVLAQQSEIVVKSDQLVMSGHSSLSELTTTEIPLYRNGAKVTVSNAITYGTETTEASKAPFFSIFGAAHNSSIFAGYLSNNSTNNNTKEGCGSPSTINSSDFPKEIDNTSATYCHPTHNTAGNEGKTFIIVKAKYQEKDYFYRLDLKQKKTKEDSTTGEEEEVYLDLLPNHWYQVMIESVDGAGYTTPEEASKHPISLITYDIHDHAPIIYNMVSDGIHELGVTHEITYSNEGSAPYLYVKCFSKYDDELESPIQEDLKISSEQTWLGIGDPKEVKDEESTGLETVNDPNHTGKVYKYPLTFKETQELGTLNGNITVTWKGLIREVPVTWKRNFSGTDLCNVKLTIYNSDTHNEDHIKEIIEDYWGFLTGNEVECKTSPTSTNLTKRKLWGIAPGKNNGKVRNQGLHFPVMYGDQNSERWSYEYEIEITGELKQQAFQWLVTIENDKTDDKTIENNIEVKVDNSLVSKTEYVDHPANSELKFKITRKGKISDTDYSYGTAKFVLNLKPLQNTNEAEPNDMPSYSFDLYHTGFFHKDDQINRADIQDSNNYYYYEVVPIMGAFRMRYWLDRNLGAKSSGMYIEATGGTEYDGDKDAAGGYYKVAEYNKYNDPQMLSVAPPGYRVPQQKVWDAMRNSDNFHTEVNGNHFESYYLTDNTEIGKVYFPKAMMRTKDGEKIGESRAGYYWTRTAATGTEKDEIGRWLKTLMISGSSTSYINGNVETYRASVRCINDIPDNNIPQRFSFNVNGATHVYLYRVDKDDSEGKTKVPTTAWPGHVIGNYATMEDGWFNFSYETADFNPDIHELYVIFNFLDKDGIIHTMSQETISDPTMQTLITPLNAKGWKVVGDKNSSIEDKDEHHRRYIGIPTKLGYWWKCDRSSSTVYCYNTKLIRIYLRNNTGWDSPRIYLWIDKNNNFYQWPGIEMRNTYHDDIWYYDIDPTYKNIIFNNGSDAQTSDLTINEIYPVYDLKNNTWIKKE